MPNIIIKEFVAAANKTLKTDANGDTWLTFNEVSRKVTVHVKNKAWFAFSRWFGNMIGFDKEEVIITKKTEVQLPVDLEAGFHAIYLDTDTVEPQLVGDSKVSLLKVIRCGGEFGENISVNILNLQYVPVTVKSFEKIEIDIKDDTQENVAFEFGELIVTLHFRQRRSALFI